MKVVSDSILRARVFMGDSFLGKTLAYLDTPEGRRSSRALAFFYDIKREELSVVFDEKDKIIFWIGPTTALPRNAKRHSTIKD